MDIDEKNKIYNSLINIKGLYITPNIPLKKAANAIKKYAFNINSNDIEILYDDTLFGGGGDGFIITADNIFFHGLLTPPIYFYLDEISNIYYNDKKIFINNEKAIEITAPIKENMDLIVSAIKNLSLIYRKESNIPKNYKISLEKILNGQNIRKSTISPGIPTDIDTLIKFNLPNSRKLSTFHLKPHIKTKLLANAIKKYAKNVNPDDVIMLYDNTIFGSGANGLLCTKNAVYSSLSKKSAHIYPLDKINSVVFNGGKVYINDEEIIAESDLEIAAIIKGFISDLVDISR